MAEMAELDTIEVERRHLEIIKSIFARYLPYKKVWAYGSRVKWTAYPTSDLDCVVFGATYSEIADAKEAFSESDIPFKVSLLNWEIIPDDFKENIMEQYFVVRNECDWGEYVLGSVLEIKYGKDHKLLPNGSIPVYGSGGLIRYVSESIYNDESILIPRKGSLNNILYKKEPFWTVDTMFWSKIDKKMVSPKFLYYQLTTIDYKNLNVGSAVSSLTVQVINQIKISLPTLPEQEAIASVLSSLDDKIDLLHRQNKTLESIAQTLFRQWFIEEADDDWGDGKLGDIVSISSGKGIKITEYKKNGAYQVLGANGEIGRTDKYLHDATVIYTGRVGTLGNIFINHGRAWFSDNVLIINSNDVESFYFVYFYLVNAKLDSYNIGSTQPLIKQSDLNQLHITIPNKELMQKFNAQVKSLFLKIKHNQKQIKTLESMRETLLPKLISGKIRVKYK